MVHKAEKRCCRNCHVAERAFPFPVALLQSPLVSIWVPDVTGSRICLPFVPWNRMQRCKLSPSTSSLALLARGWERRDLEEQILPLILLEALPGIDSPALGKPLCQDTFLPKSNRVKKVWLYKQNATVSSLRLSARLLNRHFAMIPTFLLFTSCHKFFPKPHLAQQPLFLFSTR